MVSLVSKSPNYDQYSRKAVRFRQFGIFNVHDWQIMFSLAHEMGFKCHAQPQIGAYSYSIYTGIIYNINMYVESGTPDNLVTVNM